MKDYSFLYKDKIITVSKDNEREAIDYYKKKFNVIGKVKLIQLKEVE